MAAEHPLRPLRTPTRGFTLIEALVALLLLCLGVLGVAAMHGRAVQYAVDAEDRNRAAVLANEMASLMWASRTTSTSSLPSGALTAWQTRVADPTASGLPNASGAVGAPDTDGAALITITWRPPSRPSSAGSFSYSTRVVLP